MTEGSFSLSTHSPSEPRFHWALVVNTDDKTDKDAPCQPPAAGAMGLVF